MLKSLSLCNKVLSYLILSLSLSLFLRISVSVCLSVSACVCLCLSVFLLCISFCPWLSSLSLSPRLCMSACFCLCLCLSLCLSVSVFVYLSVCLSVCLSVSPYVVSVPCPAYTDMRTNFSFQTTARTCSQKEQYVQILCSANVNTLLNLSKFIFFCDQAQRKLDHCMR